MNILQHSLDTLGVISPFLLVSMEAKIDFTSSSDILDSRVLFADFSNKFLHCWSLDLLATTSLKYLITLKYTTLFHFYKELFPINTSTPIFVQTFKDSLDLIPINFFLEFTIVFYFVDPYNELVKLITCYCSTLVNVYG